MLYAGLVLVDCADLPQKFAIATKTHNERVHVNNVAEIIAGDSKQQPPPCVVSVDSVSDPSAQQHFWSGDMTRKVDVTDSKRIAWVSTTAKIITKIARIPLP